MFATNSIGGAIHGRLPTTWLWGLGIVAVWSSNATSQGFQNPQARFPVASVSTSLRPPRERVLPIQFIENCGQAERSAKFTAKGGGLAMHCREGGFGVFLKSRADLVQSTCVEIAFEGASPKTTIQGEDPDTTSFNFLLGNQPSQWVAQAPDARTIFYKNVYENINLQFREQDGHIEYDFVLEPGADPSRVVLRFDGAETLSIGEDGSLEIKTSAGTLRQPKPRAFVTSKAKNQKEVRCNYLALDDRRCGFQLLDVCAGDSIVIDPGLEYSTYLGGTGDDFGTAISVDTLGATYITGQTLSVFPTTPGAIKTFVTGGQDGFVTKLSATGTALVYSTLLGGSSIETGHDIRVNNLGEAYVLFNTASSDFPTTPGSFDTTYNGGSNDLGVVKLNSAGTALIYGSYVGGSGFDAAGVLALDGVGNAYFSPVQSNSTNYPTTPGAFQTVKGPNYTTAVTKLNPSGTALVYSTFLTGAITDNVETLAGGIAVDSAGSVYIGGTTRQPKYPVTPGAFDTTFGTFGRKGFITKLNPQGSGLVYSTFLAGDDNDTYLEALAIDSDGAVYVTGGTLAALFPVTSGAWATTLPASVSAFITKLDATGAFLVYSTFFGGSNFDYGYGISLTPLGLAVLVGYTDSNNFPTTPGAFDKMFDTSNNVDGFITLLNFTGSKLIYSSYLGGSGAQDECLAIATDSMGNAFVTGVTYTPNFPVTNGAYDAIYNGLADAFVSKIDFPVSSYGSGTPGCNGSHVLSIQASPNINNPSFSLFCGEAPPSSLGLLLVGDTGLPPGTDPYGLGCDILVDLLSPAAFGMDMTSDASGGASLTIPIPNNTSLLGQTFYLQAVWLWNGSCSPSPYNLSSSNGIIVIIVG